ncbi:hypothetical protein ACP4OV_016634 [Aristida adscensionis]
MALFKSNTGVLLAFVAYLVICTALLSCIAIGEGTKETCYTFPSCSVYACEITCVNRGFSKDGAYCKTGGTGETFCCCLQNK